MWAVVPGFSDISRSRPQWEGPPEWTVPNGVVRKEVAHSTTSIKYEASSATFVVVADDGALSIVSGSYYLHPIGADDQGGVGYVF